MDRCEQPLDPSAILYGDLPHRGSYSGFVITRENGRYRHHIAGDGGQIEFVASVPCQSLTEAREHQVLDNLTGPAVLREGMEIRTEEWWVGGLRSRVDGPAYIEEPIRCHDGPHRERWYLDGELHREDLPAEVIEYPDGSISNRWYLVGLMHRDGAPAFELRDPDSRLIREAWYVEGVPIAPPPA